MSNYSKDEAIKELQKKLEIEKAKFDKFVEDEIEFLKDNSPRDLSGELHPIYKKRIDELSQQKAVDKNE
jgi:hypothetical protein